jgi:lysophospholipase L1-like esterase
MCSRKTCLIAIVSMTIILLCAYFKSVREGMANAHQTIVLLGDSVFNNAAFVGEGKAVFEQLNELTNGKVVSLAEDGATISELYLQLDSISDDLNRRDTAVIISAGGNDILAKKIKSDDAKLEALFRRWMDFLKALRVKLGSANIYVVNIYFPSNSKYKSYKLSIEKWNAMLSENSSVIGETYGIIDVNSVMTSAADFVYDIEPSELGSAKIAEKILISI